MHGILKKYTLKKMDSNIVAELMYIKCNTTDMKKNKTRCTPYFSYHDEKSFEENENEHVFPTWLAKCYFGTVKARHVVLNSQESVSLNPMFASLAA